MINFIAAGGVVDKVINVVVIGAAQTGKSALIQQEIKKNFLEEYKPTAGLRFASTIIGQQKIFLVDLSGYLHHTAVHDPYYRDANIILLCSSLNQSDDCSLHGFLEKSRRLAPEAPVFVVGTKSDIGHRDAQVAIDAFVREHELQFFSTSAKKNENPMAKIFEAIVKEFPVPDDAIAEAVAEPTALERLAPLIHGLPQSDFRRSFCGLYAQLARNRDSKIIHASIDLIEQYNSRSGNTTDFTMFFNFESACRQTKCTVAAKAIGKILGMCIIAGICLLLGVSVGALFGAAIGIVAGIWSGPAALAFSMSGLLVGSVTGWTLGLLAAASCTGLAFGCVGMAASGYCFFKTSGLTSWVQEVSKNGKSVCVAETSAAFA